MDGPRAGRARCCTRRPDVHNDPGRAPVQLLSQGCDIPTLWRKGAMGLALGRGVTSSTGPGEPILGRLRARRHPKSCEVLGRRVLELQPQLPTYQDLARGLSSVLGSLGRRGAACSPQPGPESRHLRAVRATRCDLKVN